MINGENEFGRMSKQLIRSDLFGEKGNFFISTIYRRSSAILDPGGMFYETLAWNVDIDGKRLDLIAENSGAIYEAKAILQHFEVVKQLSENGYKK